MRCDAVQGVRRGGDRMKDPYYQDDSVTLYHGDALAVAREMGDGAVDCIVTSPPYFGLRDYGDADTSASTCRASIST